MIMLFLITVLVLSEAKWCLRSLRSEDLVLYAIFFIIILFDITATGALIWTILR